MAKVFSGLDGNGWYYDYNLYKEYISDKEIYDLIQEKVKTDFNVFAGVELIKLASFMVYYKDKINS